MKHNATHSATSYFVSNRSDNTYAAPQPQTQINRSPLVIYPRQNIEVAMLIITKLEWQQTQKKNNTRCQSRKRKKRGGGGERGRRSKAAMLNHKIRISRE